MPPAYSAVLGPAVTSRLVGNEAVVALSIYIAAIPLR